MIRFTARVVFRIIPVFIVALLKRGSDTALPCSAS
jgi:hypothetical protein